MHESKLRGKTPAWQGGKKLPDTWGNTLREENRFGTKGRTWTKTSFLSCCYYYCTLPATPFAPTTLTHHGAVLGLGLQFGDKVRCRNGRYAGESGGWGRRWRRWLKTTTTTIMMLTTMIVNIMVLTTVMQVMILHIHVACRWHFDIFFGFAPAPCGIFLRVIALGSRFYSVTLRLLFRLFPLHFPFFTTRLASDLFRVSLVLLCGVFRFC